MTAPNMAAITASLERSLQSFTLNHRSTTTAAAAGDGDGDGGDESNNTHCHRSATTLELNSNITLPYHWEQCLDLKTGEMYYINWRTGMKSKEDPRTIEDGFNSYFYSDYDDEGDYEGDDDDSFYPESESSSVESSPGASSSEKHKQNDDDDEGEGEGEDDCRVGGHVLVVAGCKGCFMYFMVPKQVEDCPKCCGQLLHFDRSDDN